MDFCMATKIGDAVMSSHRHLVPELRLFHGPDSLASLHRELERLGSHRGVILCGASLVREGAALDLVATRWAIGVPAWSRVYRRIRCMQWKRRRVRCSASKQMPC